MSYFQEYSKSLQSLTLSELVAIAGDKIPPPPIDPRFIDRIFNQERTFWLFLTQVLCAAQSCREAVIKAKMWLAVSEESDKKKHLIQYVRLLSGTGSIKQGLPGHGGLPATFWAK